jgi:hypothetical protein
MTISRHVRHASLCAVTLTTVLAGCLTRPVVGNEPTVKTNFTSRIKAQAVDKIDLLLAIDNSASMADKQLFLAEAVPKLVERLVKPNCVNPMTGAITGSASTFVDPTKQYGCPGGSKPEFEPIVDIHIGVVTSAMGGFGSDSCSETGRDNNDKGQLSKRGSMGSSIEDAGFLAWYPTNKETTAPAKSPYTDAAKLNTAATGLVKGAGEKGCGLEAQLESFYHFLIQPDPYQEIVVKNVNNINRASYSGVDNDLLKQRRDFLRPDSLVAIVMLTDEDDSSVDPLTIGGQGFNFMSNDFPAPGGTPADGRVRDSNLGGGTTAPRGTSICEQTPLSKECTSCAFKKGAGCEVNNGYMTPAEDAINVRFHLMKKRYGIDPQYPLSRYVTGLTSRSVPDRFNEEHDLDAEGVRKKDRAICTNPLFAKKLPSGAREENNRIIALDEAGAPFKDSMGQALSICNIPRGERDASLVFFAVIGGVPNELLHFDPNNPDASRLTDEDWVKIVGRDPKAYDYSGQDPRMVQSIKPRADRPAPGGADFTGEDKLNTTHRDWDTKSKDLQYACTFALPTMMQKAASADGDCADGSDAPLCDGPASKPGRRQLRAKAFPTIREFAVVRELGDQGIAASLCPQETTNPSSPLYGYNPAVKAIVDRLANAISRQCLPRALTKATAEGPEKGKVQCLMLMALPEKGTACPAGSKPPAADILSNFRDQQRIEQGNVSKEDDKTALPVCQLEQVVVEAGQTCEGPGNGWCYTTTAQGQKGCPQSIVFQADAIPNGATVSLQCIDQGAQ